MEIFLLLIIIILMVLFETSRNSKLNALERKLDLFESYLKHLISNQQAPRREEDRREEEKKQEKTASPEPEPEHSDIPPVLDGIQLRETEEDLPAEDSEVHTGPVIEEKIPEPQPQVQKVAAIQAPAYTEVSESWYDKFRRNNPDLEKFIGENILSKVAITILVIGIAFFVKYAIDKDWINEAARVGIGILCGGVVLGFAHRLHKTFKAFSSVLVAGGIAIFYFTIGIGFHQYHLFGQTTAFLIMLLITAFSVFISVSYDRIELAALAIIGGFATPFMVSTGQGSYQVLFTYVLILDLGMLVLAYLRKWNLVNILAYGFTMLLYIGWLESKVIGGSDAPYGGALLFGAIFYVIFVLMNIVNNIRRKRKFDALELSILLSNTFIFYSEGMHILHYYNKDMQGLFSVCMAVFNLVCAWLLYKRFRSDEKLVYMLIGLTLTFITIAAPVQLHGNYITLFWALESVLLVWLAQRSGIVLYRFASVLVTLLMFVSLFMDWTQLYFSYTSDLHPILLNKGFITGLVSASSAGALVLLLKTESREGLVLTFGGIHFNARKYSAFLRLLFLGLLYCTGLFELIYQLSERLQGRNAFFIVLEAYHLLFVLATNKGLAKHKEDQRIRVGLYAVNGVSLIIFVIGFALLPVFDLRENLIRIDMNYSGLLTHYVNLAVVVLLGLIMLRDLRTRERENSYNLSFLPALIAAVIVYLCSIELIVLAGHVTLSPVSDNSSLAMISKLGELHKQNLQVVKTGFPILWGILAFLFLTTGMKRHNKALRISGLVLIALILLKLFVYDIQGASEAGKIVAFIILGIVLLVISFMYQKIKALLIDDSHKKDKEQPTD